MCVGIYMTNHLRSPYPIFKDTGMTIPLRKVSRMITGSQLKENSMLGLIITEKIQNMGGSEPGQVCKNHPYHDQKQGVCASCLRERLTQLIYVNTSQAAIMAPPSRSSSLCSSPDDPYWSASSSNHVSRRRHHRNISDNNINNIGSISFRVSIGNRLKKSRSIAFVSRNLAGEVKNGKKNNGFWTKLLHLKGKKDQVLMRSAVSMNERLHN